MDTLTTLTHLFLINLPTSELSFYEGAFLPPNLQSFTFDYVNITKPVTVWGLQGLVLCHQWISDVMKMLTCFSRSRRYLFPLWASENQKYRRKEILKSKWTSTPEPLFFFAFCFDINSDICTTTTLVSFSS